MATEMRDRMGYHKANEVTVSLHRRVRNDVITLAQYLDVILPQGREKSLALTALQEALLWANAAIAINLAPLSEDD